MKNILSILLVLCVSIAILSACSESNNVTNTPVETTPQEYTASDNPTETPNVESNQSETKATPNVVKDSESENSGEKKYKNISNFALEGKWKNVGTYTFGQVSKGAIVVFDGANCNVFSPRDTYAFYKDGNYFKLDCTGLMGGTVSFTVKIIDENTIDVFNGSNILELKRVG